MRILFKSGLALGLILLILCGLKQAGPALVVDRPQPAQLILILAGDNNDRRFWKGIALLRSRYAPQVLVDAQRDAIYYGLTPAQLTEDFIKRSAGGLAIHVCPTSGDSTLKELQSAAPCLHSAAAHSILLVTSDYHTRRAISIAHAVYPGYEWSVAAADNGLLAAPRWWTGRGVVKNVFLEWQKLLWWELVERHWS